MSVPVDVVTDKGRVRFMVEVVDNDVTRAQGLMFRKSLAPDRGMLFKVPAPREVAFWMRNTLIPLDIIYIKADGRVLVWVWKDDPELVVALAQVQQATTPSSR